MKLARLNEIGEEHHRCNAVARSVLGAPNRGAPKHLRRLQWQLCRCAGEMAGQDDLIVGVDAGMFG